MKEGNYTEELQGRLDVDKWLESEREERDLCGSYGYCAYCDKTEEFPCANAYVRMTERERDAEQQEALAAADVAGEEAATVTALGKTVDIEDVKRRKAARKSLSFAEKYALSDDIVKERYAVMKAALTSTPKGTPPMRHLPQGRRHRGEDHHHRRIAAHKSPPRSRRAGIQRRQNAPHRDGTQEGVRRSPLPVQGEQQTRLKARSQAH